MLIAALSFAGVAEDELRALVILAFPDIGSCTGNRFVRNDFRRPFSTNEVGPSTAAFFQGGETGLSRELPSSGANFLRLAGRSEGKSGAFGVLGSPGL